MTSTGAGYLFTFQDVTDCKRREREAETQKRLAAVGQMAAGIAHEIRNPLASMSGSMQVLRQELELEPRSGAALRHRAARIGSPEPDDPRLPQLRAAVAGPDRARRHGQPSSATRRGCCATARTAPPRTGSSAPPTGATTLQAVEAQMRQIVWNLATNALRAMPDGGTLRLHVGVNGSTDAAASVGGQAVVLSVSDDGVGIPAEDLDRIFQPFHGGFAKGAGLGLAIVHRIVTDQGGSIAVHSQAGRGHHHRRHSACRAAGGGRRLAAAQGTPWDSRSISTHATDPPPTPARATDRAARILVVDDERSMRELLAIVLGREGYEVVVAENGRQALDELERRPVDLLISDIHMPDMTGLDVLRAAKGMNPDLAGIMVTAFASTETAIEALRMGAYDYIHKPFNVDELKIVVARRARAAAAAARERAAQARPRRAPPVLEHHRPQRGDAGGVRADRDDRADHQHRAGDGGVGHRQGAGRPRHPLQLARARIGRSSRSTAAR